MRNADLDMNNVAPMTATPDHCRTLDPGDIHQEQLSSLGLLAAGILHEITNPLSWVDSNLSMADLYLDRLADAPLTSAQQDTAAELKQLVAECFEGLERIQEIVHDMRTSTRPEDDARSQVDVSELIRQTLRMLGTRTLGGRRVALQLCEGSVIYCQRGKIQQVLTNLIVNAVHATDDDGLITIAATIEDGTMRVTVADDGTGIPDDVLPHLFTPMFTTKPVGKGTGLGLAICRTIIEQHQGSIGAVNSSDGGARFEFVLPVSLRREARD